ncbi:MAG TPA: hypothetical protein VN428_19855 [Bryobacteraceae bacterium]|nr:hypothetical protein [Bryobacteraceae bacterium]
MSEVPSKLYVEAVKAATLVVLLAAALCFPSAGAGIFSRLQRSFRALAARPGWSILAVALLPVLLRLAILPIYPAPEPRIHDEFGHLLLADTFASGRITNPPHPYAASFEAVYILVHPTYTAQYQPALGVMLAAGKLLFGHPWAGIVVSTGLLSGALYWMLRGWVPSAWALLGSAMAALQIGVLDYWMNSYWGGTVPAIGGTIVLGALPRLSRSRGRAVYAIILAIGLAIVMNSRPVEAFLLGLVVCGWLLRLVLRTRELPLSVAVAQIVVPIGLIVAATLSGIGYYNWRVTGNAFEFPYMLHQKLNGTPQPFWWQAPVSVSHFKNKEIEGDYLRQRMLHDRRSSPLAMLKATVSRTLMAGLFYLGVSLAVPLLFIRSAWREPQMKFVLAAGLPFALDHLTFHAFYPHYAAPECALLFLAVVLCWRHMRRWKWKAVPVGLALSRTLPIVTVLGLAIPVAGKAAEPFLPADATLVRRALDELGGIPPARTGIVRQLESMGGPHLVFVRYRYPMHHPDNEWVRNAADIDASPIVWARELDPETNRALIHYYGNRRVWLLEPDVQPVALRPYPETTQYLSVQRGTGGAGE